MVISTLYGQHDQGTKQQAFIKSFISHYECNPDGRYTHEYHPFLLNQTSYSLDLLEQRLKNEGMALDGRLVIAGYEEDAMPRYYTFYDQPIIDDEASLKNNGGWSRKLHNCFGFVTAYFFKDCVCSEHCKHFFHHVNVDSIALFNRFATVFQKHAFGKALPSMDKTHEVINKKIAVSDVHGVLKELIQFWTFLYESDLKIGDFQLAATQDIWFSIEYAKHLLRSQVPLLAYYTGPDLTYPIEVTAKQRKEVTKNAQDFVRIFSKRLLSYDEQNTVYIFCSFVDGVGKSTLLGNIKNFLVHGENIERFDHVDNSSSQLATLYQYNKHVFIADLPAQVSHFTYKPDGDVFVDAYTEYSQEHMNNVGHWYVDHKVMIEKNYEKLLAEVKQEVELHGYFAPSLNDRAHPDKAYVRNVLLLKRGYNWVPFSYEGRYYLINRDRPVQIHCCVSLGVVKSDGLKNIEAQQMLFFDGIRFPYHYDYFLNDFIKLLTSHGIKRVVFVDSLSMYPRSSRENIRINYLLQQQAILDQSFDYTSSFYKEFTGGGELLYSLQNRRNAVAFRSGMTQEALVRLGLYDMITTRDKSDLTGLSVEKLTEKLYSYLQGIDPATYEYTKKLVDQKISYHTKVLERDYGLSKQFVNVQRSSIKRVLAFSDFMQHFFTKVVHNDAINTFYEKRKSCYSGNHDAEPGALDSVEKTADGKQIHVYYKIAQNCKDSIILAPFIRMMRASWYGMLTNLFLFSKQADSQSIEIKQLLMQGIPLVTELGSDGYVYATQPFLELYTGKFDNERERRLIYLSNKIFKLKKQEEGAYGVFKNEPYRLAWACDQTSRLLYSYATTIDGKGISPGNEDESRLSYLLHRYQHEHDAYTVLPTSELLEEITKRRGKTLWEAECRDLLLEAQEHGFAGAEEDEESDTAHGDVKKQKKTKQLRASAKRRIVDIYLGQEEDKPRLQTAIRLMATLEMVVKDPDANIAVRFGNRDDFKAALKLLEKTILPYYFGIYYKEDLFTDYDHVEPLPSWDFWDSLESD